MNTSYFLVQLGFALLTFVFFSLLLRILKAAIAQSLFPDNQKKNIFPGILISLIVWLVFISVLSITGILGDFDAFPPRVVFILPIPLIALIWVLNVKGTGEILRHAPAHQLIRLQVFRVFVELLLWALFIQNLLPEQMTFEGRNFDIIAGLTAPVVAWLYQHNKVSRGFVIAWNFIGLGLLINIVSIAVLSMPTPFRMFMNEPANTIVAAFPISWLPGLLVPLAYWLHLLSLKQLLQKDTAF
jgi:hypothetical protein